MPLDTAQHAAQRVRWLAELLARTDATRVRIQRDGEEIEVVRGARSVAPRSDANAAGATAAPARSRALDTICADLVGIFHLGRPAPCEGELLAGDRELGFVEALGIRNPVHSLGAGRIVTIAADDGVAVEYGQTLFVLDRV